MMVNTGSELFLEEFHAQTHALLPVPIRMIPTHLYLILSNLAISSLSSRE